MKLICFPFLKLIILDKALCGISCFGFSSNITIFDRENSNITIFVEILLRNGPASHFGCFMFFTSQRLGSIDFYY